jgi:UDP-N-acetylmuramoyl-tripeptide--D-alanyl-D-alanine ligase
MKETEKKMLEEILGRLERMEIKGISIDSRKIKEGELFVAIKGERFDGHDFVPDVINKGAWGALVERSSIEKTYESIGSLKNIIPVENTIFALQDMSQRYRKKFDIPVIGITGSNGKTTTKEMLAAILLKRGLVLKNEGNLNNHIGVPLTLLRLDRRHRSAVIEMGMSALGEIDTLAKLVRPDVGLITNIGPAHLEFLGTLGMVANAKSELLNNLKPDGTAVLNADDHFFTTLKNSYGGRILSFGITNRANVNASDIRQEQDFTDITVETSGLTAKVRLQTVGKHNVYNALAAAAGAIAVGMSLKDVKYGLEDFSPVSMRSEIKLVKGRTVLADYYNANPGSVQAALETLIAIKAGRRSVAVLGDMLELGETAADAHREVGRIAARLGVDVLITLGTLAKYINEGAIEAGMPQDHVILARSHGEAAALLMERSKNGDALLIKGSRGMKMEKVLEEF